MSDYPKNERNTVRRLGNRGHYDRETVHAILDEGYICHAGFVVDGQPFVIPTLYARKGETILIHGSHVSRTLDRLSEGIPVCIGVTHVDGIVLARSAFHHSMNYRSVTVFGTGKEISGDAEKTLALEAISENVVPGRWDDARKPTKKELDVTSVIEVAIEDAAAKIRSGDPSDDREDYELPVWAGILPLETAYGAPQPDQLLREGIPVPGYLRAFADPGQTEEGR